MQDWETWVRSEVKAIEELLDSLHIPAHDERGTIPLSERVRRALYRNADRNEQLSAQLDGLIARKTDLAMQVQLLRWAIDGFLKEWFDELYPETVFDGSSGDPGPIKIKELRARAGVALKFSEAKPGESESVARMMRLMGLHEVRYIPIDYIRTVLNREASECNNCAAGGCDVYDCECQCHDTYDKAKTTVATWIAELCDEK